MSEKMKKDFQYIKGHIASTMISWPGELIDIQNVCDDDSKEEILSITIKFKITPSRYDNIGNLLKEYRAKE